MKIKSAKSFRKWYKELEEGRVFASQYWDEKFIGVKNDSTLGFFTMYHGDKEQVYDFLRKEVEMAEDGQAIYEFVQNAADSDSTKFYMFYDENYLIVINNGSVFSKEGIKSILNIGQSFGKQDPDKIGRYGIGFKLVHRLVGKSSGLDELLNVDQQGYRGPILFSWSEKSQFMNFLKPNEFEYVDFEDNNAPWLLKILITNFPAQPLEKVKDIDYNDIEPFQSEELKSFQNFLNSCSDKIDLNSLNSGTVFFLKLGNQKFDYLEKQQQEYLNGLSTSMHFLKSLDTLVINNNVIQKDKEATNVLEYTVKNGSDNFNEIGLTEIRDKGSDAKFKICFADNANSAIEIKKHPNIYKYFPAVKEVNNLSFVIHSNLFELSSNRQNLTETPINKKLLGLLSKQVVNKMEDFKSENRVTFKNLFTSILMSEESSSNSSGNGWQSEYYYNILLEYIQNAIPTKSNGFSDNAQNVKINKLNPELNLDLDKFGLSHIKWFEWDKDEDKLLIEEAKKREKLGIEEWDIRDIVENANLESINKWIETCEEEIIYKIFLKELEESYLRIETKEKISQIKLFKFSNDKFYSFNELIKINNLNKPYFTYINCFYSNDKTKNIKNELVKLELVVSKLSIEEYPKIFSSIILPDDKKYYDLIAKRCIENANKLSSEEKKNLFLNLRNFDNIGDNTLKELSLFCDSNSNIQPLKNLINCKLKTASWLNEYKLKNDEFFIELKPYLLSEQEEIFKEIYLPNKEIILSELSEPNEIKSLIKLYQDNKRQFFKEFVIKKTENSFEIAKKISNTYQVHASDIEIVTFIEENCANNLFVLPQEFLYYKEEDGIINKIILHNLILDFVDVNEHKEKLVNIVRYDEPKQKFLKKLLEFRFISTATYTKEDYEYKVLELVCKELKESEYQFFRNKFVIETPEQIFKYSDIPKNIDTIKIESKEFSLSKILPSTYQNSNLISDLIINFSKDGILRENLNALFGVNEEIDLDDLFLKFSEQTKKLNNAEQFFFLIYYYKLNANVDLSKLGFDIECAVFPSVFALETEKLPEYLLLWIEQGEINISSLESIGIYSENSTLVSLRKYFLLKSEFNLNTIAQDEKLLDGKMLFNTFELLKEKQIELKTENEFTVFKEMVRVINSSRDKGQELIIEEEYDFEVLEEKSIEWKTVGNFSIYLFNDSMPKIVKLDEIKDYIFYRYNSDDFAVNENSIYINENLDTKKTLQKTASDDSNNFSFIDLWTLFEENNKNKNEENKETNSTFLNDVNEFISELEGTEWNEFVIELKNILELSVSQPKEKQKLFNLIAKIKLAKELEIHFELANKDYNHLENGDEKYFVHSARGAFAYIHPNEILRMKNEGYKMALDFSTKKRIKIYNTAEEILQLNTNHILSYQNEKTMDELFTFCQANRDANKHLLIIDKNNSGEKSKVLLKLLNIEDDYQ
jgi:hypothetical protein